MKTNKLAIFAMFGIVALGLAFLATPAPVVACDYDYYNDCTTDAGGSTYVENNVDSYSESNSTSNNTNVNTAINNTNVNVSNTNTTDYNNSSPVSGSCSATVSHSYVGEVVTWRAYASGGNGYFSYRWTGTDGLSSYYPTITKRYNTAGTKTAYVEITSDAQTITRTCTVIVEEEEEETYPNVSGSCTVNVSRAYVNEVVTWQAQGTGGNGYFSYRWTGTDSLSSYYPTITKRYNIAGTKTGTVAITSNGQTVSRTCSVVIEEEQVDQLVVSCVASPTSARIGETVRYTATATGASGTYAYSWTGTDGLSGYARTVSKTYNSAGGKNATVTVTSGNQTRTATCATHIEAENDEQLVVSCYATPSYVKVGRTTLFVSTVSGGVGSYSYSWSGTDGLSGSSRTISKSYSSRGTKNATVTVTSGNQTKTATCDVVVDEEDHEDEELDGYCTGRPSNPDEDEKVTWTAYPDGGNGSYRYDWSGTDGLDGDDKSISKRYDDEGTKRATVRITSDGKTISRTCDVDVDEDDRDDNDDNDDLEAYCKASPNDGEIGDRIKWTVYPDGGNNRYTYDWDGDENLSGRSKSVTKTYRNDGRKEAEVRVKSDGDTVTARCHVDIEGDRYVPPTDNDDGIYLSSIPATGISPTMKISLFVTGMLMWSAFLAYLYIARRNEKMKEEELLAGIEK